MSVNTVEIVGLYAVGFGLGLVVVATGLRAPWLAVLLAGVFIAVAGGVAVFVANKARGCWWWLVTLLAPIFAGSVENPSTPLGLDSLDSLFGGTDRFRPTVTQEKSLGISTVWRAVNLIASSVASLPLHAYKSQEGARVKAGGRAAKLLADPHPDMTPFEVWETVCVHLLLWGNAYLLLRGTPQDPIATWLTHPGRVKVGRLGGVDSTGKKIYLVDHEGVHRRRHFADPWFGYDGICGVSPIRAARQGDRVGVGCRRVRRNVVRVELVGDGCFADGAAVDAGAGATVAGALDGAASVAWAL